MKGKYYAVHLILLLLCFTLFTFFYNRRTLNLQRQEMKRHAAVIENDLWNYASEGPEEYLTLAAERDNYASVTIEETGGAVFFSIKGPGMTPLERALEKIGLIPHTDMVEDVKHGEQVIGRLIVRHRNMNIYFYFYAFALFGLLHAVIILLLKTIHAKQRLEDRVRERTAELKEKIRQRERAEAEREKAAEELVKARDELELRVKERTVQLEASNKELEVFAYSVSHDLRAPLRHIDGFSQALLEDHADKMDEEGRDYLERLLGANRRMDRLIKDILRLSRVSRGEMHHETVDLGELAHEIVEGLQNAEPGRRVEIDISPGLTARGDARLLRLVLENLLGNAWKFTGARTDARVEFGRRTDGRTGKNAFFIRDNGAGFDMAHADKLFGAFQRLHGQDEFAGTGVGLATVRRIIHRHGGRIRAEGEVNGGATFYFEL
ncbi:MAG: hypothetical protein GY859_28520 [Desulfobacterales bacterium]|nr:hypothetical protein [Desulfobacterales bacterium]